MSAIITILPISAKWHRKPFCWGQQNDRNKLSILLHRGCLMLRQDIDVIKWGDNLQLTISSNKHTGGFFAEINLWMNDFTNTCVAKWDYEDNELRLIIYPSILMKNPGSDSKFMKLIYLAETIIGDRDE